MNLKDVNDNEIMSKYQFNNNNEEQAEIADTPAMKSFDNATRDVLSIVIRLCGLVLLFIGLGIALQVFNEALALYKDPANIERVAIAIEKGSNIDKSIAPLRDSLLGEDEAREFSEQTKNAAPAPTGIRISYFIAWVIDLLLLLLLARISLMAIKTGGELALYDSQIKRFAREVVQQNKKE